MRTIDCQIVQPQLEAYVDGELGGADVLRVLHHLDDCEHCSAEAAGLRAIGLALRLEAPPEDAPLSFGSMASAVMARRRADQAASWSGLLSRAQENHWLMIGGGATVATLVSTFVLSVILAFGPRPERGDSIAALISNSRELAGNYSVSDEEAILMQVDDVGPLATLASIEMPSRVVRGEAKTEADLVDALLAVVTDKGRPVPFENMDRRSRRLAEELLQDIKRLRVNESMPMSLAVGVRQLQVRAFTTVSARNAYVLD